MPRTIVGERGSGGASSKVAIAVEGVMTRRDEVGVESRAQEVVGATVVGKKMDEWMQVGGVYRLRDD